MFWIAVVSAIAAVASAVFAWYVGREAKRIGRSQLLVELMRDYAKSEMHAHASLLWRFHNECRENNKDVSAEFRRIRGSDDKEINNARRAMTHLYQRMAVLREAGVAEDQLLYRHWSTSDLDIIPKILAPLQKVIYEEHGEVLTNQLDLLYKLHADSEQWWQKAQQK
jgi:hypothetical protein